MNRFISRPNLPENANYVLIGEKYSGLLKNPLEKLNIYPIFVQKNPHVDTRLSGHVDLSVLHGGGERIYLAPYLKESALERRLALMGADIVYPSIIQSADYPEDCRLNLCAVGNALFYGKNVSCMEAVDDFSESGFRLIPVKQGYCGCSILPVSENALICADDGIASAALKNGFDVLKITPGFIELEGFDYGFIGGAGFKISTDTVVFTGRIDSHPDAEKISDFLKAHFVKPVFLTDLTVFDIGGAVPLTEK